MLNISHSMIDSLSLSIPHPANEGRFVSVSIVRTNKRRSLTLIKRKDFKKLESGSVKKIETYFSSSNIGMDEEYESKDYIAISDNREVVGKYVIYCGEAALRSYLNQNGEVLQVRSALFYYEHSYGEGVKSADYYQSQMINQKCYFDSFELALEFVRSIAKNPNSEIFMKNLI